MPSPYISPRDKHVIDRIDDLWPHSLVDILEGIFSQVVTDAVALSGAKDIDTISFNALTRELEITLADSTVLTVVISETLTEITNTILGHKIADYTDELGVTKAINETITEVLATLLVGHKIAEYINENGVNTVINETITELNPTVSTGHKIADYTNEDGVTIDLNETITEFSQNTTTGEISFKNEIGSTLIAKLLSLDIGNVLTVGTDGGLKYDGAGIFLSASWDDANNELDINFVDGSTISIPVIDSLSSWLYQFSIFDGVTSDAITNNSTLNFLSGDGANVAITASDTLTFSAKISTDADNNLSFGSDGGLFLDVSANSLNIFNSDGVLTGNRVLDGDAFNHTLDFTNLSAFNVLSTNIYFEEQNGATFEVGVTGISAIANGAGQTLTLQGDIVNLGGITDTYISFLAQDDTQGKILVLDSSDKLYFRDVSTIAPSNTGVGALIINASSQVRGIEEGHACDVDELTDSIMIHSVLKTDSTSGAYSFPSSGVDLILASGPGTSTVLSPAYTVTLPVADRDGQKAVVKLLTEDAIEIVGDASQPNIDLVDSSVTPIVLDGTLIAGGNKPSLTFIWSASSSTWVLI